MTNDISNLLMNNVNAWRDAARMLQISVVAPYSLRVGGVTIECIAYLPQFGSSQGMVISALLPPEYNVASDLANVAKQMGYFFTSINAIEYAAYNDTRFKEALIDWGYYGQPEDRPAWL